MMKNVKRDQQGSSEKQLLVSIVTPSYNQSRFIEDTILSIKNQDYASIRSINREWSSTDNTLEIFEKYWDTYNLHRASEKGKITISLKF